MDHSAERQLAATLSHETKFGFRQYEAIERLVAELVGGQQQRQGGSAHRLDVIVPRPDDTPIAVEIKVFAAASANKNVRSSVAALRSAAVEARRSFRDDVVLSAIVLIAGEFRLRPSPQFDELARHLSGQLLREGDDVGFDSILVGAAHDGRLQWVYFDAERFREFDRHSYQPTPAVLDLLHRQKSRRVTIPTTNRSNQRQRILLVADEWRSGHGGLSTVNRELAIALAATGIETAVLVPTATNGDVAAASDVNVALVAPPQIPGITGREQLLLRPVFSEKNWEPDVIIGHGRLFGPYAVAQQQFFPRARRVHFVHMDAEQLELAKESLGGPSNMMTADARRSLETELARSADLVVGIGPLLTETIRDDLIGPGRQPKVMCLMPGLRNDFDAASAQAPVKNRVLFVGRADDFRSKGIDIAAEAILKIVDNWPASRPHPPALVIRGVPETAETTVKARLDEIFEGSVKYYLRPFSDSQIGVTQDIAQARVVVMPSRHEGFGLAAYEAIACGVPVLIGSESGLAQYLQELPLDTSPSSIVTTRQSGVSLPADHWADAIRRVLDEPELARLQAHELRRSLANHVSWPKAVAALLEGLDSA